MRDDLRGEGRRFDSVREAEAATAHTHTHTRVLPRGRGLGVIYWRGWGTTARWATEAAASGGSERLALGASGGHGAPDATAAAPRRPTAAPALRHRHELSHRSAARRPGRGGWRGGGSASGACLGVGCTSGVLAMRVQARIATTPLSTTQVPVHQRGGPTIACCWASHKMPADAGAGR